MSLGVYLIDKCPHCGREECEEVTDGITYNLMPMLREAGWDHSMYDGWTGGQMLPVATKALDALQSHPARFRQLEPANGWGSYEDAVWFCNRLVELCAGNPTHTMKFDR